MMSKRKLNFNITYFFNIFKYTSKFTALDLTNTTFDGFKRKLIKSHIIILV